MFADAGSGGRQRFQVDRLGGTMSTLRMMAALVALVAATAPAVAQTWPTRALTMVVPYAAGSGSDVLGRIIAVRLAQVLGQQVIVENVGGAGGMTGTSRVAKAAPDGYLFGLGNVGTHAGNQTIYKNPLYNAATDFAPVALITEVPFVLVARKDLPANNLQEFIAYAKANQAKMQFGSGGTGSAAFLACVLLNSAVGITVTHVPYRGGGPAMLDLIGGRIDYWCPDTPNAVPYIENKSIKAIAILTRERSPNLPAIASAHEQGLTEFAAANWFGFFLPKGTPQPIIQKFHNATVTTVETPSVQARMKEIGADPVAPDRRSPDYLQRLVELEIEKWAAPIKASGISAD
jgi:tripartite-type tricarboxylate transporter receptor subunit TctC